MAPEVILKQPYSKAVDWWSFGVIIYEMVCGTPPFYTANKEQLFKKIISEELSFPSKVTLSSTVTDLLHKLLQKKEANRLGYSERDAEEIKEHAFFKDVNWSKLLNREIKPPFVPHLKTATDVDYFSTDFTDMDPNQEHRQSINSVAKSEWSGFTFIPPSQQSGQTK
mmetsp:Transcript_45455/g.33230  ORF Transcript_45455/g.33230 Transcript_45455/m.33230 type:complete len:167 (+) Transcript_45455:160-660(+)